jgi:acyl dehydratase
MTRGGDVGSDDAQFTPGQVLHGQSRTVTDAEIAFLPALMGAINPLFHDEVTAKAGPMGTRILYGPALLGISIALTEHLLRGRVVGLVEITSVRFRRPVRSGDTVTAALTVRSCDERAGKSGLLLSVDDEVHNQDGELVLSFARSIKISP